MKIAMICSGLGNIRRGHEVFVRDVFDLLKNDLDITLFKGGGTGADKEVVVDHIPRYSPLLNNMHVASSSKWRHATEEEARLEVEMVTFSYSALKHLLAGEYDIIHGTENQIVDILYRNRLLFKNVPRFIFSNGGALPRKDLPTSDFVQEYTSYNLKRGAPEKSFLIPHGVNLKKFDPSRSSDFRKRHKVPDESLLILSVGTICFWHKRMDYLIREAARVKDTYLVIVGEDSVDTPEIKALGERLLAGRVLFLKLPHETIAEAYQAADLFVLASLFETFGLAYIEAMAMGVPVIATNHVNQKEIIKKGIFIDMKKPGNLAKAITSLRPSDRARLGAEGREVVERYYDLSKLKGDYLRMYNTVNERKPNVPSYSLKNKIRANILNLLR